jgi:hypothetical protein
MNDWQQLLDEAQQAMREQQDNPNDTLGDDMTPQPDEHFMGRWRGDDGVMVTRERGTIDVYLVWDRDGKPGFLYRHARLVQEVDAERPQVGDRVLVLRGPAETFEKNGEQRTVYPYVLRRQPCDDPLPEQAVAVAAGDQPAGDDDIPF